MIARFRQRRSFIIVAVLVVTGSALLVGTSLLFVMQAQITAEAGAADRAQSRLLALSGTRVLVQRLHEQRERILEGELPRVDDEYELYETNDRVGVIRLIPDAQGRMLEPEAAKLDLNAIDTTTLARLEIVGQQLAEAIIRFRDESGTLHSVAALLDIDGVTPELLFGPLEEIAGYSAAFGAERAVTDRLTTRFRQDAAAAEPRGLAELVTVYGVEPALQRSGALRINLDVPWSEELAGRVDERFGPGASDVLRGLFMRGKRFQRDADIIETLLAADLSIEQWPDVLDALTTEDGVHHYGRIDLNTARAEALAAMPGLDDETASQIVRLRTTLSADERATIAWPAIQGVVPPEVYRELAGRVTTRCWTYRIRFAAGERRAEARDGENPDQLLNPLVYEIVVDLADPAPRLAYLRDVTLLPIAAKLVAAAAERDGRRSSPAVDDATTSEADTGVREGEEPERRVLRFGGDDFGDNELEMGSLELGDVEDEPVAPAFGAAPVVEPSAGPSRSGRRIGRWTTQ